MFTKLFKFYILSLIYSINPDVFASLKPALAPLAATVLPMLITQAIPVVTNKIITVVVPTLVTVVPQLWSMNWRDGEGIRDGLRGILEKIDLRELLENLNLRDFLTNLNLGGLLNNLGNNLDSSDNLNNVNTILDELAKNNPNLIKNVLVGNVDALTVEVQKFLGNNNNITLIGSLVKLVATTINGIYRTENGNVIKIEDANVNLSTQPPMEQVDLKDNTPPTPIDNSQNTPKCYFLGWWCYPPVSSSSQLNDDLNDDLFSSNSYNSTIYFVMVIL